jgi:AAA family ATP:ADP antiporter
MLLMISLICFSYDILRNVKDAVVVTASGAEVIPFIKVWVLLPMAVLLTVAFTKLSNKYSQERVFYIIISGFLLFFTLFAFVVYPLRDVLHPHDSANALEKILPSGFRGLVAMYRTWTFTAFYVMCELWGSMVLSVLFWGFANEVTRIFEARRFYSVFAIGANCAGIIAGQSAIFLSQGGVFNPYLPFGQDAWEQTLMSLVLVVTLCGIGSMVIFRWMNKNVLTEPAFDDLHRTKKEAKAKGKLSMKDSFSYLSNSKYLICIAIIVVSYNLVINLVEVVWKDQLRRLYPLPTDYNNYMNNLTSSIGIVSTITALFMARIINRFGWTRTALITPLIMLLTCAGFFCFYFFQDYMDADFKALFGASPLAIAVFFGAAQNCLSKAAKYSVFDSTKEMAFIPLSHECKLKGKAAIDGVGSRMGKSGGSLIHTGLLMCMGSLTASAPYVAGILFSVILFWISATRVLGREFNQLVATESPEPDIEPLSVDEPEAKTAAV